MILSVFRQCPVGFSQKTEHPELGTRREKRLISLITKKCNVSARLGNTSFAVLGHETVIPGKRKCQNEPRSKKKIKGCQSKDSENRHKLGQEGINILSLKV